MCYFTDLVYIKIQNFTILFDCIQVHYIINFGLLLYIMLQ